MNENDVFIRLHKLHRYARYGIISPRQDNPSMQSLKRQATTRSLAQTTNLHNAHNHKQGIPSSTPCASLHIPYTHPTPRLGARPPVIAPPPLRSAPPHTLTPRTTAKHIHHLVLANGTVRSAPVAAGDGCCGQARADRWRDACCCALQSGGEVPVWLNAAARSGRPMRC